MNPSTFYVYVDLGGFKYEWRTVRANDWDHAIAVAEGMPDVVRVLEASYFPGGVVT